MRVSAYYAKLPTPAVVVDLDIAERNIRKMVDEALKAGLVHRPHIKTHRCSELARLQILLGCEGISCAKLGEAEVMAEKGIQDILIAYTIIGEDKIRRLVALSKKVKVRSVVNSVIGAEKLSEVFEEQGMSHEVLIEVDGGLNRGGLKPGEPVLQFAQQIKGLKGIRIVGLMYYGGLIYDSHTVDDIRNWARKERADLIQTKALLQENGFQIDILSAGSSFSGKVPEELKGITEIRSGHYIFNDCSQIDVGLAGWEECALGVISTVIAKPDPQVVIADAGTKTLTSDKCHHREGFGYVLDHPEVMIYALNEEHAFLRTERENPLQIGDKICIIPNHACVVPNLVDYVYAFRNGEFAKMLEIDARGKSV